MSTLLNPQSLSSNTGYLSSSPGQKLMKLYAMPLILLPLLPGPTISEALSPSVPLDLGYRQMYDLQFAEAHRTFAEWGKSHEQDPMAPTSDAAAYLFAELDRLNVLQTQLFVDNDAFKNREKPKPDPKVRAAFDRAVDQSDQIADGVLKNSPNDVNALLAKVLNQGLRADYSSLVDKRDIAALSYIKAAGILAQNLLAVDPHCYDAYLAVGVENYMLSLSPAPVRWLLRLYGAETDRQKGIKNLHLTAEKGHYLLPYAKLLLAVAALRDNQRDQARAILKELAQEFPDNRLYKRELARIQ